MNKPLLQVTDLKKYYTHGKSTVKAVDGVSFHIEQGSTLALVGESGCGKSTTGRLLLRLAGSKTDGQVLFRGQDLYALGRESLRRLRPKMQLIFQDPFSSLSPRMPIGELIAEGVREHGIVPRQETAAYVAKMLDRCGLTAGCQSRYPHEFSGGQRQRIAIARALSLQPEFVVCDEPVSALDVSVQAQIVNLLQQLQQEYGLSYLFISHDLSVVEHLCDRVAVMYLGRIVEMADTDQLYRQPLHPYTRALFSAIPQPDPDKPLQPELLSGAVPSPAAVPPGCRFHTRCPYAMEVCRRSDPELTEVAPGHFCACHLQS